MDFGSILAAIEQAVQQVIDWIVGVLDALIGALNTIFQAIWQTIVNLVNALVAVFQKLATFFVHLWQDYIKPAIKGLIDLYQRISDWLKRILGPILRIIDRIRKFYYDYIYKWVKLAENILSVVRAFLAALRIVGVKWAAKLDAELQKIQGYITDVFATFVAALNQASTWLNFIADPLGIVRRDIFHLNLFSSVPELSRAVNFGKDRYLTASEAQDVQDDGKLKAGGAAIASQNADGSITYGPSVQRMNANFDLEWNNYGNPKMPN